MELRDKKYDFFEIIKFYTGNDICGLFLKYTIIRLKI